MDRLILDKKDSLALFKNDTVLVTHNCFGPFIRDNQTIEHICKGLLVFVMRLVAK